MLPTTMLVVQVSNERGFRIGAAQIRAAHLPDGTTAFWGTTAEKHPVARRWSNGEAPWRIDLALDGTENAAIELEMSMDPWQYSLDLTAQQSFRKGLRSVVAVQVLTLLPGASCSHARRTVCIYLCLLEPSAYAMAECTPECESMSRTAGLCTVSDCDSTVRVVVQVVEARGLLAKDFNGKSDPYVLATYNKRAASTRTIYECLSPVWGDVLLFQENRCAPLTDLASRM